MKFLAIIFSVLVMALTAVPCCAYDNCADEQTEQNSSDKPETPCSPFIRCTCSPGIFVSPSIVFEYIPLAITVKNNTRYKQFFTSLYSSSIWQPPKYNC